MISVESAFITSMTTEKSVIFAPNKESENYGLMTAYDDCCEEHERR